MLDGKITQSLVDIARKRAISVVAGMGFKERVDGGIVKLIVMENMPPEGNE